MPLDLGSLKDEPRILIEAHLKPLAGTRFQPTGFPDLGPATYDAPSDDGGTVATLLVESAQSMANRMEAVCWDEGKDDIAPELTGLPYVKVKLAGINDTDTTCSLLEFHRLNSPYIMSGTTKDGGQFSDVLKGELKLTPPAGKKKGAGGEGEGDETKERDDVAGVVNLRRLAEVCFKHDPNSLVHGVFLEKIAGRLRHPRALSAFIEASGVGRADSGGVKFDRALPKPSVAGVDAKGGYGNVPFHRSEFTAKSIVAFFSLDLAQIRGYGLAVDAADLLIVLSLWKLRKFLDVGLRLRTACDLELGGDGLVGKRPTGFALPTTNDLATQLRALIAKCRPMFAEPTVTELTWTGDKKKVK